MAEEGEELHPSSSSVVDLGKHNSSIKFFNIRYMYGRGLPADGGGGPGGGGGAGAMDSGGGPGGRGGAML